MMMVSDYFLDGEIPWTLELMFGCTEEAVPGLAADEEVDEKIRPVLSAESRSNTTATTTTLANAVAETDDTRKQY